MPPKPKFTEGERVLCFHGPLMYEAKTVKGEVKDKTIKYLIHYNGWNKSWDEWVPESRVLKYGEAALQKQKELKKAHEAKAKQQRAAKNKKALEKQEKEKKEQEEAEKEKAEKDKEKEKEKKDKETKASTPVVEKGRKGKSKDKGKDKEKETEKEKEKPEKEDVKEADRFSEDGSTTSRKRTQRGRDKETKEPEIKKDKEKKEEKEEEPPRKRRIKADSTVETEETYLTKVEVKVRFPDDLKPWLIDDYDFINRQKQLVSTPARVSVDTILDDFVRDKLAKPNNLQREAVLEVSKGIKDYFNVMLGTQLLYKFERPQYAEILANHPDKPMTEIYGAAHLLRLFVRIGGMLAYTQLDEKAMTFLLIHLHDFLKFMSKNISTYLMTSDYTLAPPEYHRKAL